MTNVQAATGIPQHDLKNAIDAAGRMIPPSWPLDTSVAVNPFFGQGTDSLANVAARLGRISDVSVVMPRDWYQNKIASGEIVDADLQDALEASLHKDKPSGVLELKTAAESSTNKSPALPTITSLATRQSDIDWCAFMEDRLGLWAGGYFDQGQALWAASRRSGAWKSWCAWATHDLSPQIQGLRNFPGYVDLLPETPVDAIAGITDRLGIPESAFASYFHQLLLSLGGWAQYARHELWKAELAGRTDNTLTELLAIRLCWEEALYLQYEEQIAVQWQETVKQHAEPLKPSPDQIIDEILQEAAERASQRNLSGMLSSELPSTTTAPPPQLQAAFCIDVRSEVYRRALESVDPSVQTLGFAGFFGLFTRHRRFGSDIEENRFPVLLNSTLTSCSGKADDPSEKSHRYQARSDRAWGRFKLAAVSSFAFVEAMGPAYLFKLLRDALGLQSMQGACDPAPRFEPDLDIRTRIDAAETILRAMSLTAGFGKVVLIAGHGGNVVNNPFASGLHCGACGGYAGDVNARLLALILNDPDVRSGLTKRKIEIPDDTLFVGALHDTTTDRVTLFDQDGDYGSHADILKKTRDWLDKAGIIAREERKLRLPGAGSEKDVLARAHNWAEVRPEWGLAGCQAFIAAPRLRTSAHKLDGRAFLHNYDWKNDAANKFGVLELIMTAPVVVASWISLQYYGSTVAPDVFGSGNKLLHNVVGGIGVLEGNGGKMRAGLPWQSVHDGNSFAHQPLRLSVCIEAPVEAMTAILQRHDSVRALFDNRWLHLFALDDTGRMASRYKGNLTWEPVITKESENLHIKVPA
ncbi:DUF2309 family protein [Alphaproteobacteria bacterium HT1-32]|nr:DUF2309 family protein [Alphaproteobacteria bacterium HT1-32]